MGVDLEIFPVHGRATVDEMFILSQPAHVQRAAARELTAEERDILRAESIRTQLSTISKPNLSDRPRGDGGRAEPELEDGDGNGNSRRERSRCSRWPAKKRTGQPQLWLRAIFPCRAAFSSTAATNGRSRASMLPPSRVAFRASTPESE